MGCSGSTQMVPATSDISLKPTIAPENNTMPNGELVLKDLPDVVEKVLDSLKESEFQKNLVESVENSNLSSDSKEVILNADKNDIKHLQDTIIKSSTQGVTQGSLIDSVSSSSKQSELEQLMDENIKSKNKNSSTISSDIDSLRTSSPESEIEEALANNNDQNPPTPKPTFSELQNLIVGPVNTVMKSYVTKTTENIISLAGEKNPAIDNSDKSEDNTIPTNRKDPTEWEKQADLLALTQKYNPIEAMRKFRRENGGERSNGSSLIQRNEFKPKIQNIFEDLNEFLPLQSPLRSTLSSARSERSVKVVPTVELEEIVKVVVVENNSKNEENEKNEESKKPKTKEIKIKKSPAPERKTKDAYLIVPTNVRGVPSPSPHKVRERCAVCCNKYKH